MKHPVTRILYYVLQLTWGFLQNLGGACLWLVLTLVNPRRDRFIYHGAIGSAWKFPFSMGLGMFIFFGHGKAPDADRVLVHEFGHTVQSVVLGPLFLFVIGIPSCTWAFLPCFVKLRKEKHISYMDAYCESWANAWGEKVTGLPAPSRESR